MKIFKIYKKEYQRIGYNENDITEHEYLEVNSELNDNNQILREERYDSDGEMNTLTVNTYNDLHLLTQMEQYDGDGILLQKSLNYYNDKQLLVQQSNFFGEDPSEYVTQYVYDEDDNLLRVEMYDNDEFDYVEKYMEYDNGILVKDTENDDYGKTLYINHYEYNDAGLLSKHVREEVQNKDRRTYEYLYDANGNCIKELVYDYNNALIAKTYRTYNENNRLTSTEDEDLDNYRKVVMEYDGDLVKKNSILRKDGTIVGWAEYEYDANGKESLAKEYIPDEVDPSKFRLMRETRFERA